MHRPFAYPARFLPRIEEDHWMADAEYIHVDGQPWLIGEDENADWWVPCHRRDTPRRGGWRRFRNWNPLDWLHYWNSRRRSQVVFLFGDRS